MTASNSPVFSRYGQTRLSMKKTLIALALVALMSFAPGGEKKYTLTLTEQQVNALYYALDQSEAAHTSVVKPLMEEIAKQVKEQSDTTKVK